MTTRNVFIFIGTFVAGAFIALVVRAAMYQPQSKPGQQPAGGGDYAPMVSNSPQRAPSTGPTARDDSTTAVNPSAEHLHEKHGATSPEAAAKDPVNTVCAICGMAVDPNLETLEYHGKTIGFGCKLCAPKFKADPERYGPLYLKNEVIKR